MGLVLRLLVCTEKLGLVLRLLVCTEKKVGISIKTFGVHREESWN